MDKVVSNCNLVLVVGLVEVLIKHLNEGLLGVQLSLVVLGVNVDFVAELLCFGDTHYFTPVGQQFFLVETDNLVLTLNFGSKDVLFHLRQLLQLVKFLLRLGYLTNLYVLFGRKTSRTGASTL